MEEKEPIESLVENDLGSQSMRWLWEDEEEPSALKMFMPMLVLLNTLGLLVTIILLVRK